MKILDVLTAPWAIQPEKLLEIQAIYAAHLRGEKVDLAAVEQRLGRPLANEAKGYEIVDGVAVLPIHGVSAKRMNLFSQISGGVSTELVMRDLRSALADQAVHSIILSIDSPGGTVDGTQSLAQAIRAAREVKPVAAVASGVMASAAYWFGSAAGQTYIADETTQVGSIGVVATHVDVSGAETARGIKTTEVYAGKFKRIASQYGALSPEGRATMQDQVDHIYSVFVQAVAENRGVTPEQVLADMADGRVFIGEQAVAAGLVDGVSTIDSLIEQMNRERRQPGATLAVQAQIPRASSKGGHMLTREQIAAEAPELLNSILAEGHAQGARAERERIQAVEAALLPGHEKLIASLKFDGATTGGEAALAVLAAERTARGAAQQQLAGDAPAPVAPAATPAVDADAAAELSALPVEERCKRRWEASAAVRAQHESLAEFTALTRAEEAGRVRILGKTAA